MQAAFVEHFLDNDIESILSAIDAARARGPRVLDAYLHGEDGTDNTRMLAMQLLLANERGWTPLLVALAAGFPELAKCLLDAGADPLGTKTLEGLGMAPIHAACRSNCHEALKYLLDRGVDINVQRNDGVSGLLLSACVNACECAELLVHAGADVDMPNKEGHTPLMAACYEANTRTFELLIAAGANARSDESATIYAAHGDYLSLIDSHLCQRLAVAQRLVAMGVKIDHQGTDGASALALAAFHGFTPVVKFLLEQGASVSLVSFSCPRRHPYGVCALQFAAQAGQTEVVRLLLFAGADPDHRDGEGTTPLIAATRNQKWEIADLLIAAGAQINHRSNRGETPAQYLAQRPSRTAAAPAAGPQPTDAPSAAPNAPPHRPNPGMGSLAAPPGPSEQGQVHSFTPSINTREL